MFGSEKGYVFPVQSLKEKYDLVNEFKDFAKRENDIRAYLIKTIPEYKSRIVEAAKEINTLK